ncbi:MAG TPA: GNAT family N-acetyltransferase [Allosphingosinicella sp.]|nr:GNAT family N-acetyltransferase [Allosphingosinicella sp.]
MPVSLPSATALGVVCRPATDDDLPFLSRVYASTRTEEVASTGWPPEMQRQFLASQFDAQHRHYRRHYPDAEWLVIEKDGVALGRLYVEEWPSQVRLIDVALLPQARGTGIGSALIRDLQAHAEAAGKPLSIHVERSNRAMSLYRRLGFASVDEHGIYDLMEWRGEARG